MLRIPTTDPSDDDVSANYGLDAWLLRSAFADDKDSGLSRDRELDVQVTICLRSDVDNLSSNFDVSMQGADCGELSQVDWPVVTLLDAAGSIIAHAVVYATGMAYAVSQCCELGEDQYVHKVSIVGCLDTMESPGIEPG